MMHPIVMDLRYDYSIQVYQDIMIVARRISKTEGEQMGYNYRA